VSSLHDYDSINETTKKPTIVMNYNETKDGVESFEQTCQTLNAAVEKLNDGHCAFVYNMINKASINAYVTHTHTIFYPSILMTHIYNTVLAAFDGILARH